MTLELRDISSYQTWTDPAATRAAGIAGIIAKATESSYIDPKWYEHRAKMLAGGFVPGAYTFSRPDLGDPPDWAAEFFLNVANPSNGWILGHDAESAGGSLAWCDEFELHCAKLLSGYHVWFYSYEYWMQTRGIVGSDLLTRSPLWFAWPTSNGDLPFACSMQQYDAIPTLGFTAPVDANRFFGDITQLRRLTVGGTTGGGFLDALTPEEQHRLLDKVDNLFSTMTTSAKNDNPPSESLNDVWSDTLAAVLAFKGGSVVDPTGLAAGIAAELLKHPLTTHLSDADALTVATDVVAGIGSKLTG